MTDDAPAINQAIQEMHDAGGGTVFLSARTYLLATITPPAAGAAARYHTLIVPKSGVNIVGVGSSTVLKAADGLSQSLPETANWNFIYPPHDFAEDPLDDVEFRNFVLDANGENNLFGVTRKFHSVGTRYGANITLEGLVFANNPGRQCIQFGANIMPHSTTNITVRNCRFETLGGAVPGNVQQTDHSSIYVQADGAIIEDNTFINPKLDRANHATALEIHSSNATVSGNYGENFAGAINVVASVTDHINTTYTNNEFRGLSARGAIHTWCNHTMDGVRFTGNIFEVDSPLPSESKPAEFHVASIVGTVTSAPIASFHLVDNTISYIGALDAPLTTVADGIGISIGDIRDLRIEGNTITGMLRSAIAHIGLLPLAGDQSAHTIIDNDIIDCARQPDTPTSGTHTTVRYQHDPAKGDAGTLKQLTIQNNTIDCRTATHGVNGTLNLTAGTITGNETSGPGTHLTWDAAATINQLHVEHTGPGSPEGVVRASVGSTWTNSETAEVWDKISGGTTAEGWQVR